MESAQPFTDINVVEFGQFIAVPWWAQTLAEGDARVIKIEGKATAPFGSDMRAILGEIGFGDGEAARLPADGVARDFVPLTAARMTTFPREVRSVMRNSIGALALVGLLGWAADAVAGWVIDQSVTGGNDVRQQVVVQANRMKTVVLEPDGKPGTAFIVDLNADTITQVDYAGKTYATTPVREYVQTVAGMQQSAAQQAAEMLKNVPPELRKSVEETMRRQMGAMPGAQECVEPKIELRPTGQSTTIAGFAATRHDVVTDGKPDVQVWVARTLTAWREIDPQKLQRFASEMAKLAACGSGARGLGGDAAWRMASEGYPVRTVDASGTTVEVQKAESRTVAAAEFQPPAGFARKSLAEMMGR